MRKSCLKCANDEDAHQSMHPVRTVGSVHASNMILRMNLAIPGQDTPKTSVLPKFKVLSVDLLDMRDTQIYPFSHIYVIIYINIWLIYM